jgi:hypothetical protein
VCSLDEIARRHFVDLIPVVTVSHYGDRFLPNTIHSHTSRIPVDVIRNFSSPTLTIILNIESDTSDQNCQFASSWLEKCRQLFLEALSTGHKHVILVCQEFSVQNFHALIQV